MIPIPARKLPPNRADAPGPGQRPRVPQPRSPPSAPSAQVTAPAPSARSPRPALPARPPAPHTMNAGTRVPMPNIASKSPEAPPPRREFRQIPEAPRPASSARPLNPAAADSQPPGSIPGTPIPPTGHPANQMEVTLYPEDPLERHFHCLTAAPGRAGPPRPGAPAQRPEPPRGRPRRARLRARDHAAASLAATLELPILRRFAWLCG